jgi:transposase
MQGKKPYTEKLFNNFQLSERVPKDNFYRMLKEALNLQFVRTATAQYYGSEGQKSIDPEVFFKLLLVGYLENLNSDRRIIEHSKMRLDILYFIGYDIDEELPWHSTISRTRQLYGEEIFLSLFRQVLKQCIDKGMVRGKRQALDSALIKANASLDSLQEKEVLDDVATYSEELNENSEYKVTAEKKKSVEQHHKWKTKEYKDQPGHSRKDQPGDGEKLMRGKYLSNHTHYSTTDPDARIAVKPGKARQMNYFAQIAVDDASHVITGAMANYADKRDSQCLATLVNQTSDNLKENNLHIDQITADTGYSSAEALRYLKFQNIDAYIPNFGQYKPQREGFIYNKEQDQYECQRGNKAILPFKKITRSHDNYEMKTYRSSETACKNCPLRKECCGEKTFFKKIQHSVDKPLYDAMHAKMQTPYAKRISRIRSATVEPVLGTLINFLSMKRINTRGIKQANKHIIMAATCYNLKKLLKWKDNKRISVSNPLEILAKSTKRAEFLTMCILRRCLTYLKPQKILPLYSLS